MGRRPTAGRSRQTGGRRVLLGVTGCIAAYKAIELVRLFRKAEWDVVVVMTRAARRFVGAESFRALTGNPVALDLFPRERPDVNRVGGGRIQHVDLARSADLILIAPATANVIGKLASGIADDLLSTLLLAVPRSLVNAGRVIIAPAMNTHMWQHPSVRSNVGRLRELGYRFIGPDSGELACGSEGAGRLVPPETLWAACRDALASPLPDLAGVKVVVTAGRTEEPIDPVRCVTSRASGRMGVEVARAFAAAGAEVTLIAGPASVPLPGDVHLTSVRTCAEMRTAVLKEMHRAAALVMCAAVSDYAPAQPARSKLHSTLLNLRLLRTANILEQVAAAPHDAVVVGFSLDDSLGSARAKLERYHLDLVVANPIDTPGSDRVRPTLFYRRGRPVTVPSMTKGRFARTLVARVAELCKTRRIRGPDS